MQVAFQSRHVVGKDQVIFIETQVIAFGSRKSFTHQQSRKIREGKPVNGHAFVFLHLIGRLHLTHAYLSRFCVLFEHRDEQFFCQGLAFDAGDKKTIGGRFVLGHRCEDQCEFFSGNIPEKRYERFITVSIQCFKTGFSLVITSLAPFQELVIIVLIVPKVRQVQAQESADPRRDHLLQVKSFGFLIPENTKVIRTGLVRKTKSAQ